MNALYRLNVSAAIFAVTAALITLTPAFAAPDEDWFAADTVATDEGEANPYAVRTRYAVFDADQALQGIVTPGEISSVAAGSRVQLPGERELSLRVFDGQSMRVKSEEIAVSREADATGTMVEIIGTGESADESAAGPSVSITFTENESGSYDVRGHISDGSKNMIDITQPVAGTVRIELIDSTALPEPSEAFDAIPVPDDQAPRGANEPAALPQAGYWTIDVVAGYPTSMGTGMRSVIAQQIAQTNTAMRNSGVNIRVNLVSILPVNYRQSVNLQTDLDYLRRGVGNLRQLNLLRESVGADLVTLVVPELRAWCGAGYIPNSNGEADFAYSVSAYVPGCTSRYTFAHELGHNLGAHHAADDMPTPEDKPFTYSYAHKVKGVARSIMAYDCEPSSPCPRMLQFSNPNIDFVGRPGVKSGTPNADNARSLNEMAPIVAAYRNPNPANRIAGSDRFATAAALAQHTFPNPLSVQTVVLANGQSFADSASAAPLAVRSGGPMLLATNNSLPQITASEIARLQPERIIVIGSDASVSNAVAEQARRKAKPGASVVRIGGADRYETSLKIARYGWDGLSPESVFVATGANFPDALAAGAAAGGQGVPMLLVNGGAQSASPGVRSFIENAGSPRVVITGSEASVSQGVERSLRSIASVSRIAGRDRFETSAQIADEFGAPGNAAYYASGHNFPDGLTGGVAAAVAGAPLMLSHPTCLPESVARTSVRIQPYARYVIGSTASLSEGVRIGEVCPA